MKINVPLTTAAALVLATFGIVTPAAATEAGGNSYALGVETAFSGLMPADGFHQFVYYAHYEADTNKGNDGSDNKALAYYKLRSDTVSTRLSYVWPGVQLFGASIETRVALVLPTIDLSLGIARPAPLTPIDKSGSTTGFADPQVAPVLLGWHTPTLHQTAGFETFLPIGSYDVNKPVNAGRHYFQVAPIYAVTWIPGNGFQGDIKLRYGINGVNHETHYRSGDELSIELNADYRVLPNLSLGANGFVYRQTTDDRLAGAAVNGNGNRGRVASIGPIAAWNITPKFLVLAKVLPEFDVRNRGDGTRFWLQAKLPW